MRGSQRHVTTLPIERLCDAGSMPYAQQHYPFENKEQFEGGFPADFVAEGLDQVGAGCRNSTSSET